MKLTVEQINKFISIICTGETLVIISEMKYYPVFTYINGEYVQSETYQIKFNDTVFPKYIEDKINTWFHITLVWEDSLI